MKNNLSTNKLVIAGGGIIGITIAREAALSGNFSSIQVIEKENKLGIHASTRNSGVIHAGFYYSSDSMKAKFCSKGNKLLREYSEKNLIKINKCGKVVVTKNSDEEKILEQLYERGIKNGSELMLLNKSYLKEYEPLALTYKKFLWSPNTWSISPYDLLSCLIKECKELGVEFILQEKIISASKNSVKSSKNNHYFYDYFINASGGFALEISRLFGLETHYSLLPFKGLYLKSKEKVLEFRKHIYPVPDIKQPFLGIHTTLTSDSFLKLGPTAIPVLSPENYSFFEGLNLNLSAKVIFLQMNLLLNNQFGFRDLAFREIKYLLKRNIILKANQLTSFDLRKIDFDWYSPGIRPQLFDNKNGKLENDFVLIDSHNSIHILNSISPAWSSSFVNAKYVLEKVLK